jgi:hypothetical protein
LVIACCAWDVADKAIVAMAMIAAQAVLLRRIIFSPLFPDYDTTAIHPNVK